MFHAKKLCTYFFPKLSDVGISYWEMLCCEDIFVDGVRTDLINKLCNRLLGQRKLGGKIDYIEVLGRTDAQLLLHTNLLLRQSEKKISDIWVYIDIVDVSICFQQNKCSFLQNVQHKWSKVTERLTVRVWSSLITQVVFSENEYIYLWIYRMCIL